MKAFGTARQGVHMQRGNGLGTLIHVNLKYLTATPRLEGTSCTQLAYLSFGPCDGHSFFQSRICTLIRYGS
jgi:hypothetical protein